MGKKKKSAPMTEEERLAFEEQQILLEEETRKKKENILSHFLKDKLMHEERSTQYNMCRLNLKWREIMRLSKSKDLRKDIEMLSQTFERVIDTKDAVIKHLTKEMFESEEMYAMALRSQIQTIDHLLDNHKEGLQTVTRDYYLELEMMFEEFDLEKNMIITLHHSQMQDIEDIMFAMDMANEDSEMEARAELESKEFDLKNKSQESRQALRASLETKLEDLWQQFRHLLQTNSDTNEERRASFENLKMKDDKRSKEIEVNMRRLDRLLNKIKLLRRRLNKELMEHDERPTKDDEEDEEFNKMERMRRLKLFHSLKASMNQQRLQMRERLVRMTWESNTAIRILKQKRDKGVYLLKVADMCRKLETEEEKVLPFFPSSSTGEETDGSLASIQSTSIIEQIIDDCCGLEHFWRRYNKVMLDKLSVDKEIQTLSEENLQLRASLKQYMDSISVNDDVMNQDNPLLVINNRTNVRASLPLIDRCGYPPTPRVVIEAAHISKYGLG